MTDKASATANGVLWDALWGASQSPRATHAALLDELRKHLVDVDDDTLAEALIDFAGDDADKRAALTDIIGRAARRLAPEDEPPSHGAAARAWDALVTTADRLHGSGAYPLGRLDFIGDDLFESLLAEAREQMPADAPARRTTGAAGDALAALAVSRELLEAVEGAVGFPVAPTFDAVYEYDPPGSHVGTHVDSRDYEIVYHLLLEHSAPAGRTAESVLVTHLPHKPRPTKLAIEPGESLVLRGRGTIHSWKALGKDERRTLVAIGFERPAPTSNPEPG